MTLPLAGIRILITRPRGQASSLATQLQALGADTILIPTIEIAAPTNDVPLKATLANLDRINWIALTSANAAEAFTSLVKPRANLPKLAAVGPATARLLVQAGFVVDLIPETYTAEALAQALLPHINGGQILLPRAAGAPNDFPDALTQAGAHVTVVEAYRNVVPLSTREALTSLLHDSAQHPDAITFTSASTVVNLVEALRQSNLHLLNTIVRASIGPVTSQALAELALPATLEAGQATIPSLVAAIATHFRFSNHRRTAKLGECT